MKTAIYARYSTDGQDITSIAGQVANCEALADANGWTVIDRYSDAATSGTDDSRPDYQRLLEDSEASKFDGIIVDETSRLTRRPGELPRLVEILAFRGQFLVDCKGFDSRQESAGLLASVYSGIDSIELRKIKDRTHRGLRERHKAGYSAGGRTYGYTSEPIDGGDPDTKWRKVIDPDTAPWVVWIFKQYANGLGAKAIAAELNRRGVPSPGASWKRTKRRHDGKWQHSAILGMASRGSGILRNEHYVGRVVWNRSEWIKRPGTRIRTYRLRPKHEWIVEEHPELRIVPEELWNRVQARLANTRDSKPGRRGTYLLTGILKCFDCGGSLTMIDRRCYGCGTRHRGGDAACDNPIRIQRTALEDRFLAGVRDTLLDDKTVRWAEKEIAKRLTAPRTTSDKLRTELAEIDAELGRIADAIAKVGCSDTLASKLTDLERRKRVLTAAIDAAEQTVQLPHAAAITATWRDIVNDLGNLSTRATRPEVTAARTSLQALFGVVRVDRQGNGYADLSIGAPTSMVAGARFSNICRFRWSRFRWLCDTAQPTRAFPRCVFIPTRPVQRLINRLENTILVSTRPCHPC